MCFTKQFLCKTWPTRLTFLCLIVCRIFLSSYAFSNTSYFSHDWSNWSSPSSSGTTLQNFPGISDLLSGVSKFHHHTKLYSKCSNLLVSSLNLSLICWQKAFFMLNSAFAMAWHDWVKHHKFITVHYSVT